MIEFLNTVRLRTRSRSVTLLLGGALGFSLAAVTSAMAVTIESVGAEKCGGRVKSYEVEFLAPDNATVEVTAKALVKGALSLAPEAVNVSVDGRECPNARCGFSAKKGQSYKIVVSSGLDALDDLCVSVARPSP